MITIKEIAELCNVSTTTVSNVIHGKTKKVSNENIQKIQKVLKEQNYIPRMGLSSLTNRNSKIIGVVIHIKKYYKSTIIADPFYAELIGFLERYINESGYYMMLYTSDDLNSIFEMAVSWNVDGLIAISFTENDYQKIRSLTEKPIVAIDLYNDIDDDYYNIGLDDEEGGYIMTKHLIENGFKKILVIGNQNYGVDHQRFLGYTRALAEHGMPYNKDNFIIISDNPQKRKEVYRYFLQLVNKDYALFFLSDLLASDSMRFLQENGIVIPRDISIAGFDDNLYSRITSPQITSIHQDISAKASSAIRLVLNLINNNPIEEKDIRLPVYLVKRDSIKRF